MALPASDSFTGADNPLQTYSANWTIRNGGMSVASNALAATDAGFGESAAYWNADTPAADQYAELTLTVESSGGAFVGPAVRVSTLAESYYGLYTRGAATYFFKVVAGSYTDLIGGLPTVAVGDVLRIEAEGTTIRAKQNGVQIASITDTDLAGGRIGVCGYGNGDTRGDAWTGGNLGGGGGGGGGSVKARRIQAAHGARVLR